MRTGLQEETIDDDGGSRRGRGDCKRALTRSVQKNPQDSRQLQPPGMLDTGAASDFDFWCAHGRQPAFAQRTVAGAAPARCPR